MTHFAPEQDPFLDELLSVEEPSLSPDLGRRIDERLRRLRGISIHDTGPIEAAFNQMEIFFD